MAIVKMDEFTLIAKKEERKKLLDLLQPFDYVHIKDQEEELDGYLTKAQNNENLAQIDSLSNQVDHAIEVVEAYKPGKKEDFFKKISLEDLKSRAENFDFDLVYGRIKELLAKKEGLEKDLASKEATIKSLEPWQDLGIDPAFFDKERPYLLKAGSVQDTYFEKLQADIAKRGLEESMVYPTKSMDGFTYFIALAGEEEKEDFDDLLRDYGFSVSQIKSGPKIKEDMIGLINQNKAIRREIDKIKGQLESLAKYREDLYIYQAYVANMRQKDESVNYFLSSKKMDIIRGYLPSDKKKDLEAILDENLGDDYLLETWEADRDDREVPIILDNKEIIKPYEDVVATYALPRYNEIDPTALIAPFYTIFTGFMIGDLGYGLLGVILCYYLLNKKDAPYAKQRTYRLFMMISISACVFGFIFGSVFGGIIDVPFGWIDTSTDINTLIIISLIIGGISLFFALGIQGYMDIRDGKPLDVFYDVISWYMAVGGAIALFLTKSPIAKYIMIIGMVVIVLFGGRENKSIGARIATGTYELYGISSWIGDFVSFLRLMALVLSGGYVAYAVNLIVSLLVGGGGFGGIIAGVLVFVIFQLFNMFLSYLSAYVHSLRLVYVEMFNKFYEGGGKKFRHMIADTKFINIIRGGNK